MFIAMLHKYQLLPGHTQHQIETLDTQAEKALYFLHHIIKPSLDICDKFAFEKFLSVMENCDYFYVQRLSYVIKSEINKAAETNSGKNLKSTTSGNNTQHVHNHVYTNYLF